MSSPEDRLLRQTAGAVAWNYLSFGLGKLLVLITTAILARLLTPEEFGIVGFATLAISYISVVKDFGMGAALIQRRGQVEEAADTVFTFNLLVGICLTLATTVLAPLVATYFREPLVTPLLRLLGVTFAINALGAVHIARLQRQLDFQRKLVPDLGRALIKGAVSIGMAMMGYGVWSLVAGQLAGTIGAVIIAWIVLPWWPRVRIVRQVARSMLRFGTTILGIDVLTVLSDNMDYLIVGRLMGNVAMGLYTLAYRLPELLVFNVLWVLAAALFPAFSKVQDEPDMLRRGFLGSRRFR